MKILRNYYAEVSLKMVAVQTFGHDPLMAIKIGGRDVSSPQERQKTAPGRMVWPWR